MWSIAASHRPQSPLSAWDAASPAVTDRHSHSNSFTNIHHSFISQPLWQGHMWGKCQCTVNAITNMPTYSNPVLAQRGVLKGFTVFIWTHFTTMTLLLCIKFLGMNTWRCVDPLLEQSYDFSLPMAFWKAWEMFGLRESHITNRHYHKTAMVRNLSVIKIHGQDLLSCLVSLNHLERKR